MSAIILVTESGTPRADSRVLAERLGVQHKNLLGLMDDYQSEFGDLATLAFETRPLPGGGLKQRWALLTEDQCYFLLTLTRNAPQVVALKLGLVQAFSRARQQLASASPVPEMPTDPVELLALSLRGLQQHREQLRELEQRLDTAPIRVNSEMRARIQAGCKRFGQVHPRSYSGAYRAFKEAFGFAGAPLAAYDDLPQNRLDEALGWLEMQTRTFAAQRPLLEQPA